MKPLIGRTIQPYDIGPGGEPARVVVLSYGFWQRFFSGDLHVINRTITLDDVPRTIIGVMPPRFGWWTNEAFWLPLRMDPKDPSGLAVIVRLAPGVTQHAAEQQLNQLNIQFAAERPQDYPKGQLRTILLNYMDITVASGEMSASLHLLLAAVSLLLLIACVNVANLQLGGPQDAPARLRCGLPSAQAAAGWCGSCSPKACCCRLWAARSACCSRSALRS